MSTRADTARGISRRQFLAATALITAAAQPARSLAAPQTAGRIEIDGSDLVYGGQTLRLTGVAVGDSQYIRSHRPLSDYATIAEDWRANCVRISVMPALWRQDAESAMAALAENVAAARQLGLFVIIDWHAIGFPGYYEPTVPPDWGLPLDANISSLAGAGAFWRAMATRFGGDPAILFELWNEPVLDPKLWQATGQHWPVLKPAWEALIAEIRAHSDNIVLCAGGYWAHDLVGVKNNPIGDARTAYAWHAYPNAERGDLPARIATLGGLQTEKPIVVTEWGFCLDCQRDFAATIGDFAEPLATEVFDRFGLSHTAWCYSVGAMPNLLAEDSGTPSPYGAFARALLRQSAADKRWMLSA